jgi:hypothetical protein
MRKIQFVLAILLLLPVALPAQETFDAAAVQKIRQEGLERSQVMEIASWLTDVYGPRLTNSPITEQAGEWAVEQLKKWGLSNARMEPWGTFGRGWTNERTMVQVTAPVAFPVLAYPSAWTPGTNGLFKGSVKRVSIESLEDIEKYRGTLRDAIVMLDPPRQVLPSEAPLSRRLTDEELEGMASRSAVAEQRGRPNVSREEFRRRFAVQRALAAERTKFLAEEGVGVVLLEGRGDGGTVFVSSSGGSRNLGDPAGTPVLVVAVESYGRIARILEKGLPVTMEVDVRNTFHDQSMETFNVFAEIPGTDKADEVVMLGAHFDSWHSGTGATDNAAGSAVMLEAVRLLKTLGLPMRRTVRIGLWTGEEQGLLGSEAWVRKVFGEPGTPTLAQKKISGYFNVDNGTGAIRGVYLQGNSAVGPIFKEWMKPFADKGVGTLTISNTGGTDHLSFNAVGIPGFQFIQDPIEYSTRTHHSNMDTWERLQADDMKLNAAVVAAFVYLTANRPELLPRKEPLTP